MLFSRDLPDPGIEPMSLISPALAGGFFTTWENTYIYIYIYISRIVGLYNTI